MKYLIEYRIGKYAPWQAWSSRIDVEDINSYLLDRQKKFEHDYRAFPINVGDPIYAQKPLVVGDSVSPKVPNGVDLSGEIIAIIGNTAIVLRGEEIYVYSNDLRNLAYCAELEELVRND